MIGPEDKPAGHAPGPEKMTLEEVAEYLQISAKTVQDWAQKSIIPCAKLGATWSFTRSRIEEWVDAKLDVSRTRRPVREFELGDILKPEFIVLSHYQTKREALLGLVDILAAAPQVTDRESLLEGIFARENIMSTGLGIGLAVPHMRAASVTDLAMALAVNREPIPDYEVFGDTPVRIICMIAGARNQHRVYLHVVAALTSKLKQPDIRNAVLEAPTAAAVCQLLT